MISPIVSAATGVLNWLWGADRESPAPGPGSLDVRAHVLRARHLDETRLLHHGLRLLPRAAEYRGPTRRPQPQRQIFERAQAGGVDRRHVAQPKDHDGRQLVDPIGDALQLVGGAEEERTVDAEDRHVVGDVLVLQDVHPAILQVLRRHLVHRRRTRHAPDVEERGEHHPDLDGDREVGKHSQRERGEPHAHVGLRLAQQQRYLVPLTHVRRDDEEDGGEHGHRYVPRQTGAEHQQPEQGHRVDHAGHRRPPTRSHVGCRTSDSAGRRETAEHRRNDVGDSLGHELDVWIVAIAGHAIGDDGRHQRLDGAEHADGDRRRQQREYQRRLERREVEFRQPGRHGAEPRCDGLDRQLAQPGDAGADEEADDGAGNHLHEPVGREHQHERRHGQTDGSWRNRVEVPADRREAADELTRILGHPQPEKVADLRAGDEDRDTVRESHHDRPGDETDGSASAGHAKDDEHDARHHRAHVQAGDAVLRDYPGNDHDECASGAADLNPRSAERRDDEAGDDRAVDAGLRREARGDRKGHGERQCDQSDRDAGDEILPEGHPVVVAKREDRLWQPGGQFAVRGRHAMIIALRLPTDPDALGPQALAAWSRRSVRA